MISCILLSSFLERQAQAKPENRNDVFVRVECRVDDQLHAGSDGEILGQLESVEQLVANLIVQAVVGGLAPVNPQPHEIGPRRKVIDHAVFI